jgi:erythronate-4-phosphate dehydrogenase
LGIDDWQPEGVDLPEQTTIHLDGKNKSEEEIIKEAVLFTYDIREDDQRLRSNPEIFEQLRGDYPLRREYPVFTVKPENIQNETLEKLIKLGFQIE